MNADLIEYRVLGPIEIRVGEREVLVSGVRQHTVLAMLLLARGQSVPVGRLVDTVWDHQVPATAGKQIRNAVSILRRSLRHADGLITCTTAGYRLPLAGSVLDAAIFAEHAGRGRDLAQQGRAAEAIREFRAALSTWRGPVLAGLDHMTHHPQVVELNEQRLAVLEECVDLELSEGRHRVLARELPVWLAEYPTHEILACQLMVALSRSGAKARALAIYEQTRRTLKRELGVGPGAEMRELRRQIITENAPDAE